MKEGMFTLFGAPYTTSHLDILITPAHLTQGTCILQFMHNFPLAIARGFLIPRGTHMFMIQTCILIPWQLLYCYAFICSVF